MCIGTYLYLLHAQSSTLTVKLNFNISGCKTSLGILEPNLVNEWFKLYIS